MAGLQPSASSATRDKCCLLRTSALHCTKVCTVPTKAATYWFTTPRPWTEDTWTFVVLCLPCSLWRSRASQRSFCCWCGALQTDSSVRDRGSHLSFRTLFLLSSIPSCPKEKSRIWIQVESPVIKTAFKWADETHVWTGLHMLL